jgi:hypothetical protein
MNENDFADYIWEVEDKHDLADNYHIYSKEQFYAQVDWMSFNELKEAFPMAWESFQEQ